MKLRYKLPPLLIVMLIIAILTGCSSTTSTGAEEDPWGSLELRRIQTIQIGVVIPASGEAITAEGTDVLRGVELAIEDHGRIQGFQVEAVSVFAQCTEGGGRSGALTITSNATIAAVVGPICSSACEAAVPIFDESHLTSVSPGCGASALSDQSLHNEAFLRTLYDDRIEGEAAARFAYLELGIRRAAALGDGTIETSGMIEAFEGAFTGLGGTIVANEIVASGESDFRSALAIIAEAQADLIYAPLLPDDAVTLTVQKAGTDLSGIPLLGGRHYRNAQYVQDAGEAAEDTFAIASYMNSDEYAALEASFQERYSETPSSPDFVLAYDATQMILNAIERVSAIGAGGNLLIGRQALRNALYDTTMFEAQSGIITCSSFGDCSAAELAVFRLDSSEWELVYIP